MVFNDHSLQGTATPRSNKPKRNVKRNFKNSLIALVVRVIPCLVGLIYKRMQVPLWDLCVCVCVCVFLHSQNRGKPKS